MARECPFRGAMCHKSKKKGHLARACRASGGGSKRSQKGTNVGQANLLATEQTGDALGGEEVLSKVHVLGNYVPSPYQVTLQLNGKPLKKEINTGSAASLISKVTQEALFPGAPLSKCVLSLQTFTSEPVPIAGQMQVNVSHNGYVDTHRLVVVNGQGPSLLGRDWLSLIQLD